MILKNDVTWNSEYQYDGLLFFAQRIVEMLDYMTVDIFRAPLLNTPRLIDEYLKISHGAAKIYHLDEVYNEFMNSFKNDIVINNVWGAERITQVVVFVKRKCEQKGPKKVSTFSTRFHVVSNVFPKYQMLTF